VTKILAAPKRKSESKTNNKKKIIMTNFADLHVEAVASSMIALFWLFFYYALFGATTALATLLTTAAIDAHSTHLKILEP